MDVLKSCLLELSNSFDQVNIPLIVGGGYGLFLKQVEREGQGKRTVVDQRFWPIARTTDDIDMFVSTEVIVSGDKFAKIRAILDKLDYKVPETKSARNWQFIKRSSETSRGLRVKVDILTGPIPDEMRHLIKTNSSDDFNRVRPRTGMTDENKTHALETKEALHFESAAIPVTISGKMPNGKEHTGTILIPSAFTYLLMKLKAYEDRRSDDKRRDKEKNYAMHHAGDIYRTIATMTIDEYDTCRSLRSSNSNHKSVVEVTKIARKYFMSHQSEGIRRIRQTPDFPDDPTSLNKLIAAPAIIFPDNEIDK